MYSQLPLVLLVVGQLFRFRLLPSSLVAPVYASAWFLGSTVDGFARAAESDSFKVPSGLHSSPKKSVVPMAYTAEESDEPRASIAKPALVPRPRNEVLSASCTF